MHPAEYVEMLSQSSCLYHGVVILQKRRHKHILILKDFQIITSYMTHAILSRQHLKWKPQKTTVHCKSNIF